MKKLYDDIAENFDLNAPRIGGVWKNEDGLIIHDTKNSGLHDSEASRFTLASVMSYLAARLLRSAPMKWSDFDFFNSFLRRQAKRLWEAEMFNMTKLLRRDLKLDPHWRAQVLEDLGGWKAMQTWRTRFNAGYVPPKPMRSSSKIQVSSKARAKPKYGVKTDRDGLFRLPVIRKLISSRSSQSGGQHSCAERSPWMPKLKPIEIHPNDLEFAPNLKKLWKNSPKVKCPMPPNEWRVVITEEYFYWMNEIAKLLEQVKARFFGEGARIQAPP